VLPLRYPWLWRIVGWALVGGVCIGSVLPERALAAIGLLEVPDKVEHVSSYFVLMIWFAGLHARRESVPIAIGLVALGFGLELVQGRLGYRTFDWFDLLADTVGVAAGWILSVTWLEGWCQRVERRLFASSG
jgi:hypothetical protein